MASAAETPAKRPFNLIYWPGIPGRGEHIRLVLEEASADYTDTAHAKDGVHEVMAYVKGETPDDGVNAPLLAPPILKHGNLVINQTPNILLYLGTHLGLVPDTKSDPDGMYHVNGLALTALDGLSRWVPYIFESTISKSDLPSASDCHYYQLITVCGRNVRR